MKASLFVMLIALLGPAFSMAQSESGPLLPKTNQSKNDISSVDKDGTLIVLVTWGDIDNTPANDVYIEAHGYVVKDRAEESFVLKMAHAGHYEVALPPGVYDVFVSEGDSVPRCKRVLISPGCKTTGT